MAQSYKIIYNNPQRIGDFVSHVLKTEGWSPFQAIGLEKNGTLIAGVVYDNYNGTNIFAHIASTGSHWLTKEFLWYMHYYPFIELNVKSVCGMVSSKNKKVIKFIEHLGAELASTIKDAHPDGELLIYKMNRNQCKYLKEH